MPGRVLPKGTLTRRRRSLIAVAAAVAAAWPVVTPAVRAATSTDRWTPRPATFDVYVEKNVPVTMHDGAVLDAEIHRPGVKDAQGNVGPAPGRFPTLLVQTPYNKTVQNPANDYLVQRGYVDVIVDIRGTGSSEGAFDGSFTAASQSDSKELVHWAAAQPWSTGKVGTHGESYYAINQLLTAAQQPPELKAIFPVVPTGDNYRSNFPGGYLTSLSAFALEYAANGVVPPAYTADDPLRAARSIGGKAGGIVLQAGNVAGLAAGDDRTYDGPAYHSISPLWLIDRIKVPTFLVGGWYDALSQRDAPMMFHELQARNVPVKLLMGPWYHTTAGTDLPAEGVPALNELQLRWFDHFVRGDSDPGLTTFGPVVYNRLGEAHWHTAPTWPVPGVSYTNAFLGGASSPGTAGTLGGAPPPANAPTTPDVLPSQPASGACTRSTYVGTFGLAPSTPCETDDRVNDLTGLTYDLPVPAAGAPLDLTGPVSAHLYLATNRSDAFVTLHLEDVTPDGTASELTGGWDSLVFRELDEARSTKVGGNYVIPFHPYTKYSAERAKQQSLTVYEWWVELRPVAARIAPGHALRLSIQTSDTVRFLPTGTRVADQAGSVLSVYHDATHPSSVVLPLTP
jgi:putative CocE/NonD family hydrolase